MLQRCAGRTGWTPAVGPDAPELSWSVGRPVTAIVVGADGNPLTGAPNGNVTKHSKLDGAAEWEFEGGSYVYRLATTRTGRAYVLGEHAITALDGAGTVLWTHPLASDDVYPSELVVLDDDSFVVTRTPRTLGANSSAADVTRFDANGQALWTLLLPGVGEHGLATNQRFAYIAGSDGVHSIDLASGKESWLTQVYQGGYIVDDHPLVTLDGDTVLVGTRDDGVALSTDGKIEWRSSAPPILAHNGGFAFDARGFALATSEVAGVGPRRIALRPDGTLAWSLPVDTSSGVAVAPIVDGEGKTYFLGNAQLEVVDSSGVVLSTQPVGTVLVSAMSDDGTLYLGDSYDSSSMFRALGR